MKETKERGITLIVLIITVIIMLILAAVTISIMLGENGIIKKAKDAKEQTQMEADREKLLEVVMGCMDLDKRVVFTGENGLDNNLPEGFSGSNGIYTKGGYQFTVNELGTITVEKIGAEGTDIPPEEDEGIIPDIEIVSLEQGLVGSIITLNEVEYIVMSKDLGNGTVDLISSYDLGSVALGYEDENAIENVNDPTNQTEIAIYSYNHAVETLVMACVAESGIDANDVDGINVISIRCPGNNNVKYTSEGLTGSDSPGNYSSTNIKNGDENYLTDMETILNAGNGYEDYYYDAMGNYWLASRIYNSNYGQFGIRFCIEDLDYADDYYYDPIIYYEERL